jgi:putative DNA primase/helicase
LQQHLGVIPGDEKTSEIRRVLRSYALVATAGEWASDWGLTGWESGAAYAATQTIAERWLHGRGRLPFEQTQTLKKVQEYLTVNEHRFIPLSDAGKRPDHGAVGPVYQDDTFIYLLPAALAEMARELHITKTDEVLEALAEGGFLESGGEKNSLQKRLPSVVPNRPRAYRIRRTILNLEGDREASSDQPEEEKQE